MASAIAGTQSYIKFGGETTFRTAAGSTSLVFGHGQKISSLSMNNNMERYWQLGQRDATTSPSGKFEGNITIDFQLTPNGYWWAYVLGSTVVNSGAGPYTHTYKLSDTVPSITIENGFSTDTAIGLRYLGAKTKTAKISAEVGKTIDVNLDMSFADVGSVATSSNVVDSEDPFIFSQGTLTAGSAITDVQKFELTIDNSSEQVWGLGDRRATQMPVKNRKYDIKATLLFEDAIQMNNFFGATQAPLSGNNVAAATSSMNLTFDNGLGTTNSRKTVVQLGSIYWNQIDLPQDPTELIKLDITGWAVNGGSVIVTNNTSTG